MADKPARALVIYGDGLLPAVGPQHSHLHELAASGSCGFLALRSLAPSVSEAERVVAELAQLLDVHDVYSEKARKEDSLENAEVGATRDSRISLMSDRFMGIKAAMVSNSRSGSALGKRAGFSVMPLIESPSSREDTSSKEGGANLPRPSSTASRLLSMLGLQESGDVVPNSNHQDFVLLHLAAGKKGDVEVPLSEEAGVEWLDSLLASVKNLSQPGTKVANHLFLVVVLGYGSVSLADLESEQGYPTLKTTDELSPQLAKLRPRQSYTLKEGKPVECVRDDRPLLAAYHQVAVTRRDEATSFGFEAFEKHGGNLTILADRFLYEVAFKLWKAPKYGA